MYCSVSRRSVLGLKHFISYTEDMQSVFERYDVDFRLFAYDKHAYVK